MSAPVAPPTLSTSFEPPGRSSPTPAGVPPDGPPFQATLETESARTAIAEGQKESHSQAGSPAEPPQSTAAGAGAEGAAVPSEEQVAAALALAELPGAPPASASPNVAPAQDVAAAPPQTAGGGPGASGGNVAGPDASSVNLAASPADLAEVVQPSASAATTAGPGPVAESAPAQIESVLPPAAATASPAQTGLRTGSQTDQGAPATARPVLAELQGSPPQAAVIAGSAAGPSSVADSAGPGEAAAVNESGTAQAAPVDQAAVAGGRTGGGSPAASGVMLSARGAATVTSISAQAPGTPTTISAQAPGATGAIVAQALAASGTISATAYAASGESSAGSNSAEAGPLVRSGDGSAAVVAGAHLPASAVEVTPAGAHSSSAPGVAPTGPAAAPVPVSASASASARPHGATGSTAGKGESAGTSGPATGVETAEATGDGTSSTGEPVSEELSGLPAAPGAGESGGSEGAVPTLGYGVGLQQAIEAVNATIELAARGGLAQARIALEPEELGEIRIHLTQTASGLLARVTADSPAAAQALAAGHLELRQSLSSAGLSLARLEIGHGEQMAANTGEGPAQERAGTWTAGDTQQRTRPASSTVLSGLEEGEASADAGPQEAAPASRPIEGGLVDVLV